MKVMNDSELKSQINDSFIIARNHENGAIQSLLEKYLDQVIKMAMLARPQGLVEELGNISITGEDNKLNLVTRKPAVPSKFEESDLASDGSVVRKIKISRVKGKFKFSGEVSNGDDVESGSVYFVNDEKVNRGQNSKSKITDKKNKFVLISSGAKGIPSKANTFAAPKVFKPSDSNAVFLRNSKIDNQPVTDVLKSRKFKLSQGPESITAPIAICIMPPKTEEKPKVEGKKQGFLTRFRINKPAEPMAKSEPKVQNKIQDSAPIPSTINIFKLLKGPKGDTLKTEEEFKKKAEQGGDISLSAPAQINPLGSPKIEEKAKMSEIKDSDKPEVIMFLKKPKKEKKEEKKEFKFSKGAVVEESKKVIFEEEIIEKVTIPTEPKKKAFKFSKSSSASVVKKEVDSFETTTEEPRMGFKFSSGPSKIEGQNSQD